MLLKRFVEHKQKNKTRPKPSFIGSSVTLVAGVVGIEPTSKVLETPILPLNHTPMYLFKRKTI